MGTISNQLATKPTNGNGQQTFSMFLTSDAVKNVINQVIGNNAQAFMTNILSAVTNNPALQACDKMTLLNSAFLCESLKLSPSPQLGQFYIVPFNDKKNNRTVATPQIGFKGYIQLAIRSGYYKKLNVVEVKEGELVKYDPLSEEIEVRLIEDDTIREKTPTIGYYAMFEYSNGFKKIMYWSKKKMESHADKYSAAFSMAKYNDLQAGKIPPADLWKYSSFWYKNFDEMAKKTMLRQLISKWGIMSIELQKAIQSDMAVVDQNGNPQIYVDNLPEENYTNIPVVEKEEEPKEAPKQEENKPLEPPKSDDDFFNN